MKIYSPGGNEILDIIVDDTSVRYRSIMNDDSLTLNFSTTGPVTIPRGAYCDFEGARYTLFFPSNFKKHGSRNFQYTVVLHGHREALKLYKFKDLSSKPYRLKFPLAARPEDFLQLIVDNMNLHDAGWSAGDCIVADEKLISFNHEYCLGVLNRVAEEFSTEWEITGKTIHLRKVEKFKDDPLQLSYGMGNGFKTGVGRQNSGDKQPIGRLYVEGGERNIDFSTYGSLSLLLPKSATLIHDGKTYRTDADGMYITRDGNNNTAEDSYDGSNHYPRRVGTVSEVIIEDVESNFYDIIDSSIPESLDYGDCRIAGEKATIVFQTGALAGREFDIEQTDSELTGYIHAERRFKIVPAELDGQIMPGGVFVPSVGDKYAIFNISMPSSYIRDDATKTGASWDMFREAVKYFAEHENDRFIFTGELDGVWSKSKWLEIGAKIVPGGHVLFSDPQFQPGGVLIRITDVKDHVNMPQKPEITLSNAPVSGSFSSELGKLEAEEVYRAAEVKSILRLTKRQYVDAIETITMLASSFLDFSDSIDPITVRTMQLLVGDESLQFDFVTSMLNPRPVPHNVSFNPETKVLTAEAGLIQHLTLGIDSISVSHPASAYKFWNMSPYTSPPLIASKAYFLYARCSKSSSTGVFLLSETAIDMHADADQYHLLVGIVNKERDGGRSFAPLYGFTEILPGRITARVIASQDGRTYFDLLQGIIRGNITFISLDDDGEEIETELDDWVAVAEQMIDAALLDAERANNATDALELYVDNAFRDGVIDAAEAKAIEKYINSINEIMSKAQASYQKVFLNQYLEGVAKTDLENAKINLWGQRDTLLSAINTAIADGETTVSEKQAVDNAFTSFNTLMSAFQGALEDANQAIQTKLDALSTEKVDNLQIGGRNLFSVNQYVSLRNSEGSTGGNMYSVGSSGALVVDGVDTATGYDTMKMVDLKANTEYIFTFNIPINDRFSFYDTDGVAINVAPNWNSNNTQLTFKMGDVDGYIGGKFYPIERSYPAEIYLMAEKGNKATDWSPAPEDVEANIETAKTEAESAAKDYANIKSEAERVLAEAYADGKVSAEEQARIDDVNAKLAAAKAHAEAQDALLKTQQEAYADGKISTAEQAAIDAAKDYADLKKTEAEAYADGIVSDEEARAIADALDKYNASKAHAEQLVNDLEIGGRNLVLDSVEIIKSLGLDRITLNLTDGGLKEGTYTISFNYDILIDNNDPLIDNFLVYSTGLVGRAPKEIGTQGRASLTFNVTPERVHPALYIYGGPYALEGRNTDIIFTNIKLERGNKATDWTPAPEDVQTEIDENKQKIEAEKTRVDEIVSDNVADPSEKQYLLGKWQEVQAEYEKYNNQAIALGVSKTAFENAYYALTTLLAPLFADLTTSTTIGGESIRTAFENYYNARATLITALTNKVNSNASAAQSAANKAQGDVDALDDSFEWLEDYVDHAFRDGVIEESEAKAIEKYLNIIRTEKLAADSSYTQVHNSTHLEGTAKTNLSTAKTALNTAYNNLVSAVNSAISDGKVDSTEKATVDNRFGLFNTAIATFQTRLEEANKAIQDTIKAAADAAQSAADDAQDTADTASLAATVAAQAAAQAQAQANLAAAKTEGFTQIGDVQWDSGLIFTSIMKLFDAGSGDETAGISGILGSLRNQPSFWSGGTYEEAILLANFLHHLTSGTPAGQFDYQTAYSNLAPVTILHNGAAKIGDFIVFENGTIVMIDPESGTERLMFSISDLDEISQLLTPVVSQGSSPIGAGSTSSSQVLSGSVNVTKAGASATFTGTNMFLSALGRRQDTGSSIMVAQLFLRRNGVRGSVITSRSIFFSEETNTPQTASIEIPEIAMHLSGTGLYTIELVVDVVGNVLNAYATTSASNLRWKHTLQGVRRQQYGRDGMYFFYSDRHHYFSETRGFDGRAPADKWNAPGVLASGSASSGGHANKWGAKAGNSSVISGGYRITLVDMTHNNYVVQVTPHTGTSSFRVGTKTSTYFEIFGTGGCDYVVIGNNY